MPIIDEELWNSCVANNKSPYGKCCVDVAQKAMEILDAEPGDFNTHDIICRAEEKINIDGITGHQAFAAAFMISLCHSRGDEFRHKWNTEHQIHDEGDKENETDEILDPSILVFKGRDK